jgi:hypothetical protein
LIPSRRTSIAGVWLPNAIARHSNRYRVPATRNTIGLRTGEDDAPCLRRRRNAERASLSSRIAGMRAAYMDGQS